MLSDIYSKLKFECLELKIVGHRDITLNCQSYPHTQIISNLMGSKSTCFKENVIPNHQNRGFQFNHSFNFYLFKIHSINTCLTEWMHNRISECLEIIK